jgi:hypothetical protein
MIEKIDQATFDEFVNKVALLTFYETITFNTAEFEAGG